MVRLNNNGTTFAPGTTLAGSGTLALLTPVTLQTDLDVGTLQVVIDGATFTGNYTLSNQPGGALTFNRSVTFPGSLNIGGSLSLASDTLTVTVSRYLTLQSGSTLNNPGKLQVGAFVDQGGTINGNLPIVIGLPGGLGSVELLDLQTAPSPLARAAANPAFRFLLTWSSDEPGEFAVEASTDLRHWQRLNCVVENPEPGRYTAGLGFPSSPVLFFRVVRTLP
jgi:hypothetical protein